MLEIQTVKKYKIKKHETLRPTSLCLITARQIGGHLSSFRPSLLCTGSLMDLSFLFVPRRNEALPRAERQSGKLGTGECYRDGRVVHFSA